MLNHNYCKFDTIENFLSCPTPIAWIRRALKNIDLLLIDHAHCEKKAASNALSFLYQHTDKPNLMMRMSKIAREELSHFEQVQKIIQKRNIPYQKVSASRYATELRQSMRTCKEGKFVDSLIVGAFIEARSCERFLAISEKLDEELKQFYQGLFESEKRHFTIYLDYAREYSTEDIAPYILKIRKKESELILSKDEFFHFHSGV